MTHEPGRDCSVPKLPQLPFEISGTPERNVIQQLSTYVPITRSTNGCDRAREARS